MASFEEGKSPGAVIAAARRQRGWTLDDLADRTKIPAGSLAALEADEYHRLSGPIYARSFVRSCAKELGLPVEDVLALMGGPEREAPRLEAAAPSPREENVRIRRVGMPWGRVAAGAIVVAGLAVGAVLWAGRGDEAPVAAGGDGAESTLATMVDDGAATAGAGIPATEGAPIASDGGPVAGDSTSVSGDSTAVSRDPATFTDGRSWPLVVRLVAAAPVPVAVRRDAEAAFVEVAWATAALDTLPAAAIEAGRAYALPGGGDVVYWTALSRVSLRLGTVQGVTLTVNGQPRELVAPPDGGEVTVDLMAAGSPGLP